MKKAKTKKIGLLLAMLTFLTLAVFFLPGAKPAAADGGSATYADLLNCNQTFQWVDYAHISCQLSDKKPIVFSKSNPDQNDGSGHYVFAPPPGVFDGPDPALTFEGVQDEGLVVQTNNNWTVLYFNEGYLEGGVSGPQSFIAKYNPINLQLYGGADGISGGHGGAPIKPSAHSISSTDSRSAIVLQGTADGAQSLPDVTSGKFAGYNFVRWKSDYDPSVKGAKVYLFAQNIALNNLGQDCTGDILAVTADSSDNSAGAREYTLGRQGDPLSTYSDLNNLPKDQTRNCRVSSYNFGSGDIAYPTQIYISPAIQKMGKIGEQNVTGGGTGSSGSSDTASSCISDSGLSWIVCPVINGLSESADVMNGFIEGQLNFSVQDNLGGSVHSAWTIFRTLTSIILVIVMLVMVFSQAIGGGPFDAYTVRKLLPKLVAAIILIQISWPLCLYAIQLANDAGQAIGQLMAAPFGGPGALELGSLLKRWNEAGGIIVGIGATGLGLGVTISEILTGGFLIKLAWPILTLAALLILIAVLTDFAVLLIRNALIVLLVMTAPLAFIAYVMPGMETYWKKWRENFIRVLFFFPLLIAIIYGGRIFAWVVGGLGTPGPLDLIMILVAFFGPYFFLPKAFKWAGPGLAAAANAVTNSWPISKGREAAKKGLMDRQQRGLDAKAKELNPDKEGYAKARRFGGIPLGQNRKLFRGLPYGWSGNLSRTAVENLAAGRVIPTKRGLGAAVKRGDDWKANEEALDAARVKRGQDKAAAMTADEVAKYNGEAEDLKDMDLSSVPYTYRLDKDGNVVAEVSDNPTARSKASILNDIGNANPQLAGMAVDRALKTQSWIELMKNLTAITDEDLKEKIKASGAEYWEGNPQDPRTAGKLFVRPHDVPRFASKINSSEDLYVQTLGKALLTTPHISNPEGKSIAQMQKDEIAAAKKENRQPRELVSMTSMQDPQLRQLQKAENEAAEREKRPARNLAKPLEQLQAEEN
ncbi:MAG TPA: hypothetical protein VFK97_00595, partial [Candidatus Saccharimonadales bacterium]|nr:hypothetical protein [Candidatus Saccharimonadales bacterium]